MCVNGDNAAKKIDFDNVVLLLTRAANDGASRPRPETLVWHVVSALQTDVHEAGIDCGDCVRLDMAAEGEALFIHSVEW